MAEQADLVFQKKVIDGTVINLLISRFKKGVSHIGEESYVMGQPYFLFNKIITVQGFAMASNLSCLTELSLAGLADLFLFSR